jgi:hypothetical protein
MFPRSFSSFDSEPKSPLVGAWLESIKLNVNLLGVTKSLELQNPSSSFAILEVLPEIPSVINVDHDEILLQILDSIAIDLDEIVELLDS